MEYFVVQLRLADRDKFLLWFQSDVDGFYVESGKIVSFEREDDAIRYGREQGFKLSGQPATGIDMNWISYKSFLTEEDIDCVKALNVWNFLADVASSLPDQASEFLALDTKPNAIYDKLFWGNNLPAVTPPGEEYQPAWSHDELSKMQSLFLSGITLLKNNLADHESSSQAVGIIR